MTSAENAGRISRTPGRLAAIFLAAITAGLILAAGSQPADSAVRAKVTVSPQGAKPGSVVSTAGSGFPERARGNVVFGGRTVARFTTSAKGKFAKRWAVPEGAKSGRVEVEAGSREAGTWLRVAEPLEGKRWSNPATWGGTVPGRGETVTIPEGKTVVLDTSPPALDGLTIEGTLLFEDKKLTLRSDWIMVHGKLQVGTEDRPFRHRAEITLTDNVPGENVMGMGDKGLIVMGGTLDLHGQNRLSWTKLAATAAKGSNKLVLARAPDWRPGDEIVVSSTDYDQAQDEEATVTAVSGNTVTLDRRLQYTHWGEMQTYRMGTTTTSDDRTVDERAEVGLLSRNVTVRGEPVSSSNGFGGQIMAMHETMDGLTEFASMRLQNVELEDMGQKNLLRRYPVHFHMLGAAGKNSYLKNSAIHDAFNRCVTVHGTDQLRVQNNVCSNHVGHGYFFEDGAETDNLLTGNLGLGTRRPADGEGLLPSDANPATFWITNPDNTIRGNVAAGSEGHGFWLAFPEHPTGLSADANVWPRRTPLGEFSGNTSHSNNNDGLHVDGGPRPDGTTETTYYHPRKNPADGNSAEVVADFSQFTAYKNRNGAVWLRGENHRLSDATLADNAIGATFASHESFLQDSFVVGETANKGTPEQWQIDEGWVGLDGRSLPRYWWPDFPIRGYEFYDGRVGVRNTSFVNFTPNGQRKASGLGVLLDDAFQLNPKNFATSVRFFNANRVYMPDLVPERDGDASAVFVDTNGSVAGTAGKMVVKNNPFLLNDTCRYRSDWNAHVCDADYATLTVGTGSDDPADIKPVKLTREDGAVQTLYGCCEDSTNADSTVLSNESYAVDYNGETTPERLRFVLMRGGGRWVNLSVDYPVTPRVTKYGCDVGGTDWCGGSEVASLGELDSLDRSGYYYDAQTRKLHVKIFARDPYNPDNDVDYEELVVQPG